MPQALRGMMEHASAGLVGRQSESTGVRGDWNGRMVRLSGFAVLVEFKGAAVTAFILAPYAGACVQTSL